MPRLATLLLVVLSLPVAQAEEDLPRRPFLGVRFQTQGEGVVLEGIVPGGSAERMGLRPGDRILSIYGIPLSRPQDLPRELKERGSGAAIALEVERGGERLLVEGTLAALPLESAPGRETIHGSVRSGEARLRTILTVPPGEGRRPALMIVQGLGPMPMDDPFDEAGPYRRLVDAASAAGFATLRVDKPGVGDSEGGPYEAVDFATETAGFLAALRFLAAHSSVDPARVFLFGHSMGGIMGPLLAKEVPLAGIVVYGTSGRTWVEYEIENLRRQDELGGGDPAALDATLRLLPGFLHAVYFEGKSRADALAASPGLHESFGTPLQYGKDPEFFRQIARTNLAEAWSAYGGQVLVHYGAVDFVAPEEEHLPVARAVNAAHPGHATLLPLEGGTHAFQRATSMEDAFRAGGERRRLPDHPDYPRLIVEWLVQKARPASSGSG